ncbi:MAG TPA: cysteine--tRNA ligase [Patescibacteria group bacterium]|nr:cysteine--tRNA ligase [Patescibacteria group bacterium]
MKLHNTLTRSVQDIQPLQDNTVRIYTCGPTVYDHAHIGNLSTYVFADTLRRAIQLAGFETQQVMNYTDVDDKTIRRSHEQFPDDEPREALANLTEKYIAIFNEDMDKIGNDIRAVTFVSATESIEPMKELITKLHAGGFAYIADDGVYFSIEAYRKSGKTYGQLLEITAQSTSEARIQNDEYDKESVHDFALWKKQKDGEPSWEFTLDGQDLTGRPGWHIECSAMSRAALGQPFDIHTGGVDNIFPHHENEIAQSTALEDNPVMATIFAHAEHVLVDGKKMSKSAQNFYTLQDIIDKGYDPLAFRLKVLQSHYRNQANFTWESLDAAVNLLNNLRAWADLKHQKSGQAKNPGEDTYKAELQTLLAATQDDLDTPKAISALAMVAGKDEAAGVDADKIQHFLNIADRLFGLQLANRPDITHEQKDTIAEREAARLAKDWAKSDQLRAALQAQGIDLRDTPNGPVWFRV